MKTRWLINVIAYTLAGASTSAFIGATLGLLGGAVLPAEIGLPAILIPITVGLLAIARELHVVAVPLPQIARQTRDVWAKSAGGTCAAIRWGLDLGLVFTTWFTFPGIWLLAAVAVVMAEPGFGAALFTAYWVGRALSVWVGPLLLRHGRETSQLLEAVDVNYPLFQKAHVIGLALGVSTLGASIVTGAPL